MINALKSVRLMSSSSVKQAVSELSVPVPWGEIRGRVWGPEHGSPVLCLHGWADNSGTFNTLLPLLPKDCRYVAMDLAGHGCSSHRPPGVLYSFPSYVMDVRRVVEGVCLQKLIAKKNFVIYIKLINLYLPYHFYLKAKSCFLTISSAIFFFFFQHAVATVPGNHHVHLNNPENVAPLVSDFLQTKVLSLSSRLTDGQISKL
uniref:Serine hydrolase like n=1 Tax=Oryzias sinensis TaxID=183150 RepID=A0A8C7ZRA6_9TELE